MSRKVKVELGKVPSLNSFYAGSHWTKRKKAKDEALERIKAQLGYNKEEPYHSFSIVANVRYRYDLDNSIIAIKFTCDALKTLGWVIDDSPKHFREAVLVWDPSLTQNTAEIEITLTNEHQE